MFMKVKSHSNANFVIPVFLRSRLLIDMSQVFMKGKSPYSVKIVVSDFSAKKPRTKVGKLPCRVKYFSFVFDIKKYS